jgi:hypothetical protein
MKIFLCETKHKQKQYKQLSKKLGLASLYNNFKKNKKKEALFFF